MTKIHREIVEEWRAKLADSWNDKSFGGIVYREIDDILISAMKAAAKAAAEAGRVEKRNLKHTACTTGKCEPCDYCLSLEIYNKAIAQSEAQIKKHFQ